MISKKEKGTYYVPFYSLCEVHSGPNRLLEAISLERICIMAAITGAPTTGAVKVLECVNLVC